jgi:hypothetical protein
MPDPSKTTEKWRDSVHAAVPSQGHHQTQQTTDIDAINNANTTTSIPTRGGGGQASPRQSPVKQIPSTRDNEENEEDHLADGCVVA